VLLGVVELSSVAAGGGKTVLSESTADAAAAAVLASAPSCASSAAAPPFLHLRVDRLRLRVALSGRQVRMEWPIAYALETSSGPLHDPEPLSEIAHSLYHAEVTFLQKPVAHLLRARHACCSDGSSWTRQYFGSSTVGSAEQRGDCRFSALFSKRDDERNKGCVNFDK
jgi:hypothetical protein